MNIELLKIFLINKKEEYNAESDISGMFSGSYWEGKADAIEEIYQYILINEKESE